MNIRVALLLLFFLYGLMACGDSEVKNTREPIATADTSQFKLPQPSTDTVDEITGLLQTSGLQPDEARALGITNGRFQILSQNPYFIEGPDSLEKYLGQCLKLEGTFAPGWADTSSRVGSQTTYGRKLFVVERATLQPSARCFYSDSAQVQPQGREVTYTGQVERMERPAPDIAYDYQLRLQKPYRDANNPYQPGRLVQHLPLVSDNFRVLNSLEQALRQNHRLRIRGVQHRGYAESEALWIVAADSLAL